MKDDCDPSLDALLILDGEAFIADPEGRYWVRFIVKQVPPSPDRPHGLSYSPTLHDETGARLVGFDNAHAASAKKGRARAARDEGSPAPAANDPALRVPGCGHAARGFLGGG
jgi:hypothetical protein